MKRAISAIAVTAVVIAVCIFVSGDGNGFIENIGTNWDIELPDGGKVAYISSNRGGLHGDGRTYAVVEYSHPLPDGVLEWNGDCARPHRYGNFSSFAEVIYENLNVLEELRHDPAEYDLLYMEDKHGVHVDDMLLIYHRPGGNALYIIVEYT